ncbi:MAG: membrane protein insertase YidC [Panacagrimonas sp.]
MQTTENRRYILLAVLGVIGFFLYQAWSEDYRSQPTQVVQPAPVITDNADTPLAQAPSSDVPLATPPKAQAETDGANRASASAASIKVSTDVMQMRFSSTGADLRALRLIGYPVSKDQPEAHLPLFNDDDRQYMVLHTGLAGTSKALSTPDTVFTTTASSFSLADGQDVLEVPFVYEDADGYRIEKRFIFRRGSYHFEVEQRISNQTGEALTVSDYARIVRSSAVVGAIPKFAQIFLGVGLYEQKEGEQNYRFSKTKLKKLDKEAFDIQQSGGWIAMLQHYFAAAILPPDGEHRFSAKPTKNGLYQAQYVSGGVTIPDGQTQQFSNAFYIGPKLQTGLSQAEGGLGDFFSMNGLNGVAPGLDFVVDYGLLTPLSEPLFWLLDKFHGVTGNWGWSIILLTLVVKALFYKLSEKQYRSMAKMKKFAPRIQDLKERYGDDRERMSKAMMELYKKEGFNPLAGCWPLLVQFPVFIALYWVLLESVELRQADFALWINDLSAPDPYYVLPVLYGLSFFLQQKMSGQTATMDPMQQKIMNIMPILMTGFFAFFQSGLVLYWLMSNLVGIAQQWYIMRKLAKEDALTAAR